jgi:hypothetical protein
MLVLEVLAATAVVLGLLVVLDSWTAARALRRRGGSGRGHRPGAVASARRAVRMAWLTWVLAAFACFQGFLVVFDPNSIMRWVNFASMLGSGMAAVAQMLAVRRARALLASCDAEPAG